jgi:SSS family solute:Na+ symporter/sodium/pantothenate symporter
MHYLELIADRPLVWGLFAAYMAVTCYLAWLGHRRTGDMTSFAIGKGDMHPVVVGVTLAASIASTATFVINPGFVYVHGISALMHLGVAAGLGIIVGLFTLSFGFRRVGAKSKAITLPGWIAERYRSRGLAIFFALVSLLSLSFVVLILGGLSIVMQQTLGLSNIESLVLTVVFVFGYVFVGGTYAHAYTNTLQGILMVVIALLIVASGLPLLGGPGLAELAAAKPEWMAAVNPSSPLFSSFFSVFVAGFLVGFALVCQPHILTKALYVKSDRAVRQYLTVTVLVSITFTALLLVGVYAHLAEIPAAAFVDPATGAFRQDQVMAVYLAKTFDPTALAVITVALLAAGMSTLDGILVALSSIAASDLFLRIAGRRLEHVTAERRSRLAHRVSQLAWWRSTPPSCSAYSARSACTASSPPVRYRSCSASPSHALAGMPRRRLRSPDCCCTSGCTWRVAWRTHAASICACCLALRRFRRCSMPAPTSSAGSIPG